MRVCDFQLFFQESQRQKYLKNVSPERGERVAVRSQSDRREPEEAGRQLSRCTHVIHVLFCHLLVLWLWDALPSII